MAQRRHYTYYEYKGQYHLPQLRPSISDRLHLQIAHRDRRHSFQYHRLVEGNHAQRQYERSHSRQQEHHAVHPVESLPAEHQSVEHIEHDDEHSHLGVVYQKVMHPTLNEL